jgi:hypothetical protein
LPGYEWVAWEGWTACPEGQRTDRTRRDTVLIEEPFKICRAPKKKASLNPSGTHDACDARDDGAEPELSAGGSESHRDAKLKPAPKPKRMSRTFSRVDVDMDVVVELKAEGLRLDLAPEEVLMLALRAARERLIG